MRISSDDADVLQSESQQDELWLISYADLLTLLIGFFVLIIASVPLKRARFERIAAALSGSSRPAPLENLRDKVDALVARSPELQKLVFTRDDAEGLGIEFKDALLFDSGSAEMRAQARPAIAEIARLIRELPVRPVTIEGHTDDVPISTASFHSNWELSSQRAINVLNALQAEGVERERMSARAWADTRPLGAENVVHGAEKEANKAREPQDLEQRRTANRRVVIRVE
jgi:chemotaxis protein MotB